MIADAQRARSQCLAWPIGGGPRRRVAGGQGITQSIVAVGSAVIVAVALGGCSATPQPDSMTAAQFMSMVQSRSVGGIAVPDATYSEAKPSVDGGKYVTIPSCNAVAVFFGQHLQREFRGTTSSNQQVSAELYDTAESAGAGEGLLEQCDRASRPCHFVAEAPTSISDAEVTLFRTESSIEGVADDICAQTLGTQVQVRISNVLFVSVRPGEPDEQFTRAFAAAAMTDFANARG